MELPPGLLAKNDKDVVCRLLHALYGLKQSERAWHKTMTLVFLEMGFKMSKLDHSVFTKHNGSEVVIVSVSTDDMVIAGST